MGRIIPITGVLICLTATMLCTDAAAQGNSAQGKAAQDRVAVDAGFISIAPDVGYRYGQLSSVERRALRRAFKLPMDAIFTAQTTSDLKQSTIVSPLPDPNKPLLAVPGKKGGTGNPFGKPVSTHPLGVLGELFQTNESGSEDTSSSDQADDPFGAIGSEETASPEQGDSQSEEDPFDTPDAVPADQPTDDSDLDFEEDPFSGF